MSDDREQPRQKMLRNYRRSLKDMRQYIFDLDSWNENCAEGLGEYIGGNRSQMVQIAEYYELMIQELERGAEYLPSFHFHMDEGEE